jgi:hypothetical protein
MDAGGVDLHSPGDSLNEKMCFYLLDNDKIW